MNSVRLNNTITDIAIAGRTDRQTDINSSTAEHTSNDECKYVNDADACDVTCHDRQTFTCECTLTPTHKQPG